MYVVIFGVILVTIIGLFLFNKKNKRKNTKNTKNTKMNMLSSHNKNTLLTFTRNGKSETHSLKDILNNNLNSNSVFSPYNPVWFFNIHGEKDGKMIFSTHWRTQEILESKMKGDADDLLKNVDKVVITIGQNTTSWISIDTWSGLSIK